MKISCIGGGPAGLYFAILMKKRDPAHDITIYERNAYGVTFGWGVVFSDETLGYLEENDRESHRSITAAFAHWDAIDIHFKGECQRSVGHGFSGIARKQLLEILEERALALGVKVIHQYEVDSAAAFADSDLIFAADGVRSKIRDAHADVFKPTIELGSSRYIWLGTTRLLEAFTFIFARNEHGWFQVHAYRFDQYSSTFIVETDPETWERTGFASMDTEATLAYLEQLFAPWLEGHPLLENRSTWLQFPTVSNERWYHGNIALAGDAVHTAHFSIGSGTKLAMEDAIGLARAFDRGPDVATALASYEAERRPQAQKLQRAARSSRMWFENVARYTRLDPLPFAMSLLTRSFRVTYDNLKRRDPDLVERATRSFARVEPLETASPPMFQPLKLRSLELPNRVVVSPMCMYSASDGKPGDFHLVHLGSRAMGGAGLVMTEMTDVLADGRITPGCTGMYAPEHVSAWKRIVDFVHTRTRARIGMQLAHAGRKGSCRIPFGAGHDVPLPIGEGGWPILAPSPIPWGPASPVPRAMRRSDMDRVRDAFVAAARRTDQAGFDLLELHFAHGYLLGEFLSPLTNHRSDEWGGSLENRMRFPLEVFSAVRAVWPQSKPISVRISATDWVEGGFEPADGVALARELKILGLDILDVSAGQTVPEQRPIYGRMFQTGFSDHIRNEAEIPTMTVGNISSADDVNSILIAERADLVVLARKHLDDPYFTLHSAAAQGVWDFPWPEAYQAVQHRRPAG